MSAIIRSAGRLTDGRLQEVKRMLHACFVGLVAAYTVWVLLGTVAYVSHLGFQAPTLAPFLPAAGQPGGVCAEQAADVLEFLKRNILSALVFVLPHTLVRPARLSWWLLSAGLPPIYDRLLYNAMAASTLHYLLCAMVPLRTTVLLRLPFPWAFHLALSGGFLVFAAICFVTAEGTAELLGVTRALAAEEAAAHPKGRKSPPPGMDAITWMGECVWQRGGAIAFVLFTGLSILPPELTLGDVITRAAAALWLRLRSRSFRRWLEQIDGLHQLTWALRGSLLIAALYGASEGTSSAIGATSSVSSHLWDRRIVSAIVFAASLRIVEILGRASCWNKGASEADEILRAKHS